MQQIAKVVRIVDQNVMVEHIAVMQFMWIKMVGGLGEGGPCVRGGCPGTKCGASVYSSDVVYVKMGLNTQQ